MGFPKDGGGARPGNVHPRKEDVGRPPRGTGLELSHLQ